MATSLASSLLWCSGNSPNIYLDISYDASRSGANMRYTVYLTVRKPSGTFGYPIYATVELDGTQVLSTTIKAASPSSWSSYSTNTGSKTVSNKTSGSTVLKVRLYSGSGSSRDQTWTYNLPVSAAGSSISASNGTLGTAQTITLTRYSSSFTDTVRYVCGSQSGTIATKSSATSFNWTPPLALAQENTSGSSVPVTLYVDTYSGDTLVQTKSIAITCTIPDSVIPTAAMALEDANGYLSTFGGYIQGQSALRITLTGTGAQGSTISSYISKVEDVAYSGSPVTLAPFTSAGTKTVKGKVTDSRGRSSAEQSQNITVIPYSAPVISQTSVYRCDSNGNAKADGAYVRLAMVAASSTPVPATGTNINTVTYRVRYKASSASSYMTHTWHSNVTTTSVSNLITGAIALATTETMEVIFEVIDQFGTTQVVRTVPVATKFIDANATKTGLAIGQVSTQDGLQVAFDTEFSGAVNHTVGGFAVWAEEVT